MIAWLLLVAAVVGHFALHLVIYNRLNATGFRRVVIKRTEKLFVATCIIIPAIALAKLWPTYRESGWSMEVMGASPPWILVYGGVCIACLFIFGIPWLLWRPILGFEWIDALRDVTVVDVEEKLGVPLAITRKGRWQAKIPYNQIFELSVEQFDLPVRNLPDQLDGTRVAHLSDIHLTGHVSPQFSRHVVEVSNQWQPDLCLITGDIIDKQPCIDWLDEIFADTVAKLGRYFILGNHDTRVREPDEVRQEMTRLGWTDVGGRCVETTINQCAVEIIGNESPWFASPNIKPEDVSSTSIRPYRILLSHSPDQLSWARRRGVGLMFAGHTHGGQGRLPIIGPLLSPSWHGSRFASGDFYKAPTTMHVTRGLSGVHMLRWNCRPELSLITLRSVKT